MQINVVRKIPDEEIKSWVKDFIPRLESWFAANPKRKICKVGWLYGRSVDLRRENYMSKLAILTAETINKNDKTAA